MNTDIHMDPKNRELIAKTLVSTVKDKNAQYVVITPSQITFAEEDVNIITVQNIEGKSIIREVNGENSEGKSFKESSKCASP